LAAAEALDLDSPVAGSAYFLSQGEPVNCWQWIDELLALASLPPVRRSISLATAKRIGAVLELTHAVLRSSGEPRMTRFLAAQLGTSHYFNIERSRRDFGYVPSISTEEGMRRLGMELAADRS
ncbi:MAG: 3-beta hydroxysteroid dehydrogenase, partial [Planctomycetales bacterium]|nr:3-beta hydroxysteroid dehydrogenase [Planctomycetales bacterium]